VLGGAAKGDDLKIYIAESHPMLVYTNIHGTPNYIVLLGYEHLVTIMEVLNENDILRTWFHRSWILTRY
jgi:hypothetical protein